MNILVPTSWDDVTVNQYQALSSLNKDDYKSTLQYTVDVIHILCELDDSLSLPLETVKQITDEISFATTEPSVEKFDEFEFKGDKYNWIGNFNQLTVGEALSIEQQIDLEDLSFSQSFDVVLAVLLRKNGNGFNSSEFKKNRVAFGELPVTKVIGMILFFLNGGKIYTKGMPTYSITMKQTNTNTQKKSNKLMMLLKKVIKKVLHING